MRLATWNVKALMPYKPLDIRLEWLSSVVRPDVAVLTEADLKIPDLKDSWQIAGRREPLSKNQRFTTYVAASTLTITQVYEVQQRRRSYVLDQWYPGTTVVADVHDRSSLWGTVIGLYGVLSDPSGANHGSGLHAIDALLKDVEAVLQARKRRVVVAGDLNLWPNPTSAIFEEAGLVDVIDFTVDDRDPLPGCVNCGLGPDCGHLWTHRNGGKNRNGKAQQLDFVFCTEDLLDEIDGVYGGYQTYPDAIDFSDHAPVVVDFAT